VTTHVYTNTPAHRSRVPFPTASHSRLRGLSPSLVSSSLFLPSRFSRRLCSSPLSSSRHLPPFAKLSVSLVLALVACIRRRRISDISEERHSQSGRTRRRTMGEGGCENGGGGMDGCSQQRGVGCAPRARGRRNGGRQAKRGHRRSSHYDNGDRRGVSAHP